MLFLKWIIWFKYISSNIISNILVNKYYDNIEAILIIFKEDSSKKNEEIFFDNINLKFYWNHSLLVKEINKRFKERRKILLKYNLSNIRYNIFVFIVFCLDLEKDDINIFISPSIIYENIFIKKTFTILKEYFNNVKILKEEETDTFVFKDKNFFYKLFLPEDFFRIFIYKKFLDSKLIAKNQNIIHNILFPLDYLVINGYFVSKYKILTFDHLYYLDVNEKDLIYSIFEMNNVLILQHNINFFNVKLDKKVNHWIIHDDLHVRNILSIEKSFMIIDLESLYYAPIILQPFIYVIMNFIYMKKSDTFFVYFIKKFKIFKELNIYDFHNYSWSELFKIYLNFLIYQNVKKEYIYGYNKFILKEMKQNKEEILLYLNTLCIW